MPYSNSTKIREGNTIKYNSLFYIFSFIFFLSFATKITTSTSSHGEDSSEALEKRAINYSLDNYIDLMSAFDGLTGSLSNVYQIEKQGLSSARLSQPFWSYHSMPLHKGGTANRYNHSEFRGSDSWSRRHESYRENPAHKFLINGTTHKLSPLEKYELIIGRENFSLTLREWEKGKEYIDEGRAIPSWVGACHGTAPSSISHSRPKKAITVLTPDRKTSILFYPSDIKALLAFAWTTNGGPSAVMGSRCNSFKGNMIKSCLDTNPGSFHLALTNLIGLHKKPLIADTDSRSQVWNRPVIGYDLSYFNPQYRNYTRLISNAIVDIEDYHNDPFQQFRARGTKRVVGVRAEIELISDTNPSADLNDSAANDKSFKSVYTYDLELDQAGVILGGMWRRPYFPDFVWAVSHKNLPLSNSERWFSGGTLLNSGVSILPSNLRELAKDSRENNQVSYWAIEYLLRLSSE